MFLGGRASFAGGAIGGDLAGALGKPEGDGAPLGPGRFGGGDGIELGIVGRLAGDGSVFVDGLRIGSARAAAGTQRKNQNEGSHGGRIQ